MIYNKEINGIKFIFVCDSWKNRTSWGHKVTLYKNDTVKVGTLKTRYYNRTWETYQETAEKVNEYVTINSLFAPGETITETSVRWGKTYTDDERICSAALTYIQEGCTGVTVYNLRVFDVVQDNLELYKDEEGHTQINHLKPTVYHVEVSEDFIMVNGFRLKIKEKTSYTVMLRKTFVGAASAEALSFFLQDQGWKHSGWHEKICKHIIENGKFCA